MLTIAAETLTTIETTRLGELEARIERGIQTFVDVGLALMEIRDGKLYRETHGTFEDYCRERWGWERRHAYRLMDAAQTVENVSNWTQNPPANEAQARPLTSLPADIQPIVWQRVIETAPDGRITARHVEDTVQAWVEKRPVSYHVSDDSYEWYTPSEYIEAARRTMGEIDLDPASSITAQSVVKAGAYYTRDDDGLSQPWHGRVWLNPPYNMPLIGQFVDRAIGDYTSGVIDCAIVLTNNSTDTGWFHKLARYPFCLTRGRIRFWGSDDETLATRQGQAIFYLGGDPDKFVAEFGAFGLVVRRYDDQ